MKIELMVSAVDDRRKDAPPPSLQAKDFPEKQRCLYRLCPSCGSRMVRSRDLRDMCLICGYLQAQA